MPRFCSTYLRVCTAVVTYADRASLSWLIRRISDISPWKGAKLEVVVRCASKVAQGGGMSPCETAVVVLKRLEKQNLGLAGTC